MTTTWATAYIALGGLQAQIIRGLLEAAGIPAATAQEGAGAQYAFTVGPMGEVEVLVPADRLPEAEALLAAYDRGELETAGDETEAPAEDDAQSEA